MGETLLLAGLAVIGAISPLLTFAGLWQLKEWRWDRLMEHLRRENWFLQLFGRIRPVVLGLTLVLMFVPAVPRDYALTGGLTILATLAAIQAGLRKQRSPVWTQKARILTGMALALTVILAVASALPATPLPEELLPLLPFLQPLFLGLAWTLFLPLDRLMKQKVMNAARKIREANPSLTVIAITGSVGKTTTKELLAHVLSDLQPLATPAHVNTEVGVAQWMTTALPAYAASRKDPGVLIVEMGAYRKGEIALMSSYVKQNIGIVTHVGTQHIALFGSQQALFEAKSEIVQSLPADGHAFLNGDNDFCRKMKEISPCPVTIVGTGGSADLEAFDIEETPGGLRMTVDAQLITIPLHGTHNVTNILLAVAVARHLKLDMNTIARRLASFTPLSRTFQVREEKNVRILDDTYNGSAASVKAAIAWARTQPYEAKTILFAGLIEMGEEQERTEVELGQLASGIFQRAVVIDPQSARNFQKGFGGNVETLASSVSRASPGSLLVCVGRMPASTINRLLPS